jgi:pimeloyl-ACP methyl ester carboxylesterase
MPTFDHDGITFHYVDEKIDPDSKHQVPLVFQHGIGGTVRQPSALMTPLPKGVRLFSLDCRGHGATRPTGLRHALSFSTFADDVIVLMDHLQLRRAVIGGISMGAGIALNLALRFPEHVAGLVLSRPAWVDGPMAAVDFYRQIAALLRAFGAEEGRRRFTAGPEYAKLSAVSPDAAKSLVGQFEEPRALEDVARLESLPLDRPFVGLQDLARIRVPTLVLCTGDDPVHPLFYGSLLSKSIPGARFREVTSKSQSPERHQRDCRDAIASFLEEFIPS